MLKDFRFALRQLVKQPGFALPGASRTRRDSEGISGTINGGGKSVELRSDAGLISTKSGDDSAQTDSCKKEPLDE
jgi:hypothetical protein